MSDNWQPIETAPKDETVVLLWCPQSWDTDFVRVGWWFEAESPHEDSGWYDDEAASHPLTDLYGEPTHWMPLPEPPRDTMKGERGK